MREMGSHQIPPISPCLTLTVSKAIKGESNGKGRGEIKIPEPNNKSTHLMLQNTLHAVCHFFVLLQDFLP